MTTQSDKDRVISEAEFDLRSDFPVPEPGTWRRIAEKDLKGADFEKKLVWRTPEGISVQPLYTRDARPVSGESPAAPGVSPYRRGTRAPALGEAPWLIRQDCLLASPQETNAALRDGLARGQTAVGIRLDNAARLGIDGDDPRAAELAGRGGCTMSSLHGLRTALAGIDLSSVPVTLRTGASALPVLGMLAALAREQGVDTRLLTGAVEGDPIRELLRNGELRGSLELRYAELAAMAAWCRSNAPDFRPVMVNGSAVHGAGASCVQEAAYVLAVGAEYMRALLAKGIDPDDAALSISASVSVSTNLFMEIAKLRALRVMWAKTMREFGVEDLSAERIVLHARTGSWTKTADDPYDNIVRAAVEGFAAAVGGCDSMYVAPFDETLGRPDEFSSRVARNQQLILQSEAHLGRVADPGGGSYYVESLTDSVVKESWKLFTEIEAEGGLVSSLKAGRFQKLVGDTGDGKRTLVAQRRMPIVGVADYADPHEKRLERSHASSAGFLAERKRRLAELRAGRGAGAVAESLAAVSSSVAEPNGLMDAVIAAAERDATIGEISDALLARDPGGTIRIEPLRVERAAVPFETLRSFSRSWEADHGALPKVALLPLGPVPMRRARAEFCLGFLAAAGFDVVDFGGIDTAEGAVAKATDSGAFLSVLCSDDPSYPELVKNIAPAIKAKLPGTLLYVAGYPADDIERLRADGADGFIHVRSNALEELSALQAHLASHATEGSVT